MAAAKKATEKSLKKRKKLWFKIYANKNFNEVFLGETSAYSASELIGRPIKSNLMTLTNDMKKQHVNLSYRVAGVSGDTAHAEIFGFDLMPAAIKRMIRRGRDRLDTSFVCFSSDNKRFRIKTMIVTRYNSSRSMSAIIQRRTKSFVFSYARKLSYDDFIINLTNYALQQELRAFLNRTYPVKMVEVRAVVLELGRKYDNSAVEQPEEEEERAPQTDEEGVGEDSPIEDAPSVESEPGVEGQAE